MSNDPHAWHAFPKHVKKYLGTLKTKNWLNNAKSLVVNLEE